MLVQNLQQTGSFDLNNTITSAIANYLQQLDYHKKSVTTQETLDKYQDISDSLIDLFEARFNPQNLKSQETLIEKINNNITAINNEKEAEILKNCLEIISATVRTNAYLGKNYISFKINPGKIPNVPKPVPYAEIFVFSQDFEGLHLRAGKVARGGLRWSDRLDDYRTECLGLVKSQHIKNAVIVPVGAKGVFIIKNLERISPLDRNDHVVNCYKNFLRGMLDITDNVINGQIIPPASIVAYDEADPYLVVAADKGTATFSNYANQVATEYNFWLEDAFASGGTTGYDHKEISITSKGAWISLLDHLKTSNLKLEDVTFLGIGDMSGDVFGNGMLSSDKINLVAAFDHRHIFIDPNPSNQLASFAERKRLFDKPKSDWSDYNAELISKGGGVFSRKLQNIELSPEIQALIQINETSLTPNELIRALLTSKVDVIWNGGIGTYIKATFETDEDIADHQNDALRVNGKDVQAKIIVEGGNLGLSQNGRIEYSLRGGKVNADFIDNVAGVNCSDHEVNIKICLGEAIKKNKISLPERNSIIANMAQEVVEHVLASNYDQAQSISIAENSPIFTLKLFSNNIAYLEGIGLLDRAVNNLPSHNELKKRENSNIKFTRPEIATLLSYSKKYVYNSLLVSNILEDTYFKDNILPNYFPTAMRNNFAEEIQKHQLHNEIIATIIANKIVNQLNGAFIVDMITHLNKPVTAIVKAFVVTNQVFKLDETWNSFIHSNTNIQSQITHWSEIMKRTINAISWLVQNTDVENRSIDNLIQDAKKIEAEV
ncbi:hypothetical protein phytr_1550 [Candidatus Phycorickettsia trachydisci]|uniref:Uncharacterized protein n=1 Tax=Candidatus Phycorickettsia trachydisci TaxID=2115978 RepID=A0A2P1P766_9RICK|nr:NAD-glutamate dehydrogenase domain-containing protein [Candidatus Phycorickettsia trachydisci]AVP87114.1 hypothetical protein phytr_1550 [Candidatus Phycorickettsia trachydisci]